MNITQLDVHSYKKYPQEEILPIIEKDWEHIPLVNANNLQCLTEGKLVRFRGMVQDIYDPEYYLEKYEVENTITWEKTMKDGLFIDSLQCGKNEKVDFDNPKNITNERVTYVLITPPGLNDWVKDLEEEKYKIPNEPQVQAQEQSTGMKRTISSNSDVEMQETQANSLESTQKIQNTTEKDSKKLCVTPPETSDEEVPVILPESLLNFPVETKRGKACHAKVYAKDFEGKICDMIECVGFLGMQNIAPVVHDEFFAMESITHNPPASLIPRIHCVSVKPIKHYNPLYVFPENANSRLESAHKELLIIFTQLLLGDELAAQYLIFHMISKVFSRMDLQPLGKYSLNISNVPSPVIPEYVEELYKFIELMTPLSHHVPMTLENMNSLQFIPSKDYDSNRISGGILQLCKNTHLVLDETKLSSGKLNEAAVKSIGAISQVIKQQNVQYNFNWYALTYDCDIPVLVMSEGKSLLPTDCHVVLKPEDVHITTFEDIVQALKVYIEDTDLLNSIRNYITDRRLAEYEIPPEISEKIQDEFVRMRANSDTTVEDLHNLLVLARLICLSEGNNRLDESSFRKACEMESKRKERLPR